MADKTAIMADKTAIMANKTVEIVDIPAQMADSPALLWSGSELAQMADSHALLCFGVVPSSLRSLPYPPGDRVHYLSLGSTGVNRGTAGSSGREAWPQE